jgi:hypothetical protein
VSLKDVRNIGIIAAIAAIVDLVPGGGTVADVIVQAVSLFFLGALAWVAALMYREHRNALYSLGDHRRGALYAAAGVLAVTLTATDRLWDSSLGQVAWLVLIAGSLYAGGAMLWSLRRY